MRFSELFLEEHRLIRRAVAVLERMAEQADIGIYADRHDINALLIFLHYFVDAFHQTKEESILFPALRQIPVSVQSSESAVRLAQDIENLLHEHTEDRFLIDRSQLLLFSEKSREFAENAKALAGLLSKHAHHEEQYLFPAAEKIFNREQGERVAMSMEQADAQFGESQKRLLVDMLEELERKYIAKAA